MDASNSVLLLRPLGEENDTCQTIFNAVLCLLSTWFSLFVIFCWCYCPEQPCNKDLRYTLCKRHVHMTFVYSLRFAKINLQNNVKYCEKSKRGNRSDRLISFGLNKIYSYNIMVHLKQNINSWYIYNKI